LRLRRLRSGPGERQIAEQRKPHARNLQIARGSRAIRLGLLQLNLRVVELRLGRDPFPEAHGGDLVRTRGLLRGSATRVHLRLRRSKPVERIPRIELRELARLLKLRARLMQPGARNLLVAAACTDDCEPVLTVNFEELESLADRLVRCRSQMFDGPEQLDLTSAIHSFMSSYS